MAASLLNLITENWHWIVILSVVSFIQNMAFTASSRSRNSGDAAYHFRIAVCSNAIWFACHILVWSQIWKAISLIQHSEAGVTTATLWLFIIGGVYVVSTSLGSSYMMTLMLRRESGTRRVGAIKTLQ